MQRCLYCQLCIIVHMFVGLVCPQINKGNQSKHTCCIVTKILLLLWRAASVLYCVEWITVQVTVAYVSHKELAITSAACVLEFPSHWQ